MKITNSSEPLRPDRVGPSTADARPALSKAGEPVSETERVQVSDLAARLAKLESQFGGEFDTKKVDEVRQAISEGRFNVDSQAVAQKLLSSVAELLDRK